MDYCISSEMSSLLYLRPMKSSQSRLRLQLNFSTYRHIHNTSLRIASSEHLGSFTSFVVSPRYYSDFVPQTDQPTFTAAITNNNVKVNKKITSVKTTATATTKITKHLKQYYSQKDIDAFFNRDIHLFDKHGFVEIIKSAGKKDSNIFIDVHFAKINKYLEVPHYTFAVSELSSLLYGLANTKRFTPEMVKYVYNITHLLRRQSQHFTTIDCSQALYGLKNLSSEESIMRPLLSILSKKISQCSQTFGSPQIGNCLYGMQSMTVNCNEVVDLINAIKFKILLSRDEPVQAHHLAMALYGLQSLHSGCREVIQLLQALAGKIRHCPDAMNSQGVSISLYGLQGMHCYLPEVRHFLSSLLNKIETCCDSFSPLAIGLSLYGMKNFTDDSIEVRQLLRFLTSKINELNATKTKVTGNRAGYSSSSSSNSNSNSNKIVMVNEHLAMSIIGLQSISANSKEATDLLQALSQLIICCHSDEALSAQNACNILYGLQSMSNSNRQVAHLIRILQPRITGCKEPFTAVNVALSCYGLQSLHTNQVDVLKILQFLVFKIHSCPEILTARHIAMSLYGLKNMYSAQQREVLPLIQALTMKIHACHAVFEPQYISMSLFGLQNMTNDSVEVNDLLTALFNKFKMHRHVLTPPMIGMCFYGIQNMTVAHTHSSSSAAAVAAAGHRSQSQQQQQQTPDAFTNIIKLLTRLVQDMSGSFDSQTVGCCLYSLQSLPYHSSHSAQGSQVRHESYDHGTSRHPSSTPAAAAAAAAVSASVIVSPDIRNLLGMLHIKLRTCTGPLTNQALANSIYGLQNMTTAASTTATTVTTAHENTNNSDVVTNILNFLASKAPQLQQQQPRSRLSIQELGHILYGLHLKPIPLPLTALLEQEISHAYETIQHAINSGNGDCSDSSSSSSSSRESVNSTDEVHTASVDESGSCVDVNTSEVDAWDATASTKYSPMNLLCLYQSIVLSCFLLTSSATATASVDVSKRSSSVDGTRVVNQLMSQLSSEAQVIVQLLKATLETHLQSNGVKTSLYQNVQFNNNTSNNYSAVASTAVDISSSINKTMSVGAGCNKTERTALNSIERELRQKYAAEFASHNASIERNVLLHGFECDMVFKLYYSTTSTEPIFQSDIASGSSGMNRVPATMGAAVTPVTEPHSPLHQHSHSHSRQLKLIVNYEIDGVSHLIPTKACFVKRRDEYLRRVHQVVVERRRRNTGWQSLEQDHSSSSQSMKLNLVRTTNTKEYQSLASKVISALNIKLSV